MTSLAKKFILIIGLVLTSLLSHAQYTNISGKVIDVQTAAPVQNAEVYLTNTTTRTATDANGNYSINNIPAGKYELITRHLGYATKATDLVASTKEQTLNIGLVPKIIELSEVTITDVNEWKRNLERFKLEFIGRDTHAAECYILNEDILQLRYSSKTQILTAKTDDFLEVINPALGYKLRFLIKDLTVDYKELRYSYRGSMIFEELPGNKKEQKKWSKNRNDIYEGSFRHFMSSVIAANLKKNGFIVKRLKEEHNPNRPADSLINYKITQQFKYNPNNKRNNDSLKVWTSLSKMPKFIQTLSKEEVTESEILKPGNVPQNYDLQFTDTLYVIYKNKYVESMSLWRNTNPKMLQRFPEAGNKQIAAINMQVRGPATFNREGIQLTEGRLFFDGTWGDARLSKQLPLDFKPDKN